MQSTVMAGERWTYSLMLLPSIGYPWSYSILAYKQELDQVQRRTMTIIVAKCGCNQNTKREILFCPLCHDSANFQPSCVQ